MTRPLLAFLLTAAPSVALAVPAQLTTQGRVLDSAGAPVEDTLDVTFRLMDGESGGTTLWEETQSVAFTSGFYSVMLGADESGNPLEDATLDQWPLYLEVQLDGEPAMVPRMAVGSVPYARQAGVATELAPGADIDAGSLTVDGTEVVASDGTWTGPTPSVDWGDLTGTPGDFSDGDDADTLADLVCGDGQWAVFDATTAAWACDGFSDSTLTDADVVVAVGTDAVDLYAGSTMDGYTLLTDDSEIDWSLLVSVPSGLDDGDDDTLAGLACTDGQLAVYDTAGTAWVCGTDTDTTLTAAEVVAAVEAAGTLALPGGTTVGGVSVVTSAGAVDWSQITTVPSGLADGDDDTLAGLGCSDGEVASYDSSAGWVCSELAGASVGTVVYGDVYIRNNLDVEQLDGVVEVTGAMVVGENVTTLEGLESLATIGGGLQFSSNDVLVDLDGLDGLEQVGGGLNIESMDSLADVTALAALMSVGDSFSVSNLDSLGSLDGLQNLATVGGNLTVYRAHSLTDLDGLAGLTAVGGQLSVNENDDLADIGGMSVLATVAGSLRFSVNPKLCQSFVDALVLRVTVGGTTYSAGNDSSC